MNLINLTSICEEILYGKFPIIIEFFSIFFSKSNFKISSWKILKLLYILKSFFKLLANTLSFSIKIRFFGFCSKIFLVNLPVPGPISTISLLFILVNFIILFKILLSIKKFCPKDYFGLIINFIKKINSTN